MTNFARDLNLVMNEVLDLTNIYNSAKDAHMQYHAFSDENSYNLVIPLLGIGKNDLSIEAQDGILTVSAKPSVKSTFVKEFKRKFTLSSDADVDTIEAKLENGLLTLKVPKIKANKKTININVV